MLTIKHITPMGNEALYEASEASYSPHAEPRHFNLNYNPLLASVWYADQPNAPLREIRDGTVYVMNEKGSTVAKYDLGGWCAVPGGCVVAGKDAEAA